MAKSKRTHSGDLLLLPTPRAIRSTSSTFSPPADWHVVLQPHAATRPLFPAERFIIDAEPLTGVRIHLSIGQGVRPADEIRVQFNDAVGAAAPAAVRDQAYTLAITPEGIRLQARAAAGVFYAFQTLLQILRAAALPSQSIRPNQKSKIKNQKSSNPPTLPCLTIEDHPDFLRRGVYHDTARGKVPTLETLLQLVDDLGHLKYNEFQLYIENNFQFRQHPAMYDDTDPLTAEELLILDEACRLRHIDFVPSLTSLGHFEKILCRPRYRALAEAEPAQLKAIDATCWYEAAPWSLAVSDPAARQLLRDMYDEFAPNFSSPQFNICCDEAYDLGVIRSKAAAEKAGGVGQLYVDWINYCRDLAASHGKTIQLWGDIILKYPDLIAQLPEHSVLLEWGYEHDHKFEEHCTLFAQRLGMGKEERTEALRHTGTKPEAKESVAPFFPSAPQCLSASVPSPRRTFYVAPGTSSWLTLSSRTKNACGNIHNAATAGLKHGATGILVTDWGDDGHQQMLSVSLLPFAYGAAAGWNLAATPNPAAAPHQKSKIKNQKSLLESISHHLFQDPTASFAQFAYDLGLTYERFGWQRFNASVDWFLFREKWDFANYVNRVSAKDLERVIAATTGLRAQFAAADLRHAHADHMTEEFIFTCDEIIHTCRRTLLRQHWLAADPAKRNPEEPTRRSRRPVPLPKTFAREMQSLRREAIALRARFAQRWRARNKTSRLADVTAEFDRLVREYEKFGPVLPR